jgi:acyl-CoA synthetase (AMP-forming)/AMP-acid ligase II
VNAAFLFERFKEYPEKEAIIWKDRPFSYGWLTQAVADSEAWLRKNEIASGTVALLQADFTPQAIVSLLSLLRIGAIVVPYSRMVDRAKEAFLSISQAEVVITMDTNDRAQIAKTGHYARHALYDQLRSTHHPGLVLFSSGTTGEPKGIVHDSSRLLEKFRKARPSCPRTLALLILDHLGGIDTLFYSLAHLGCLVTISERTPETVLRAIQDHKVEVFPTTATFLNLLLLSDLCQQYDLSSLKKISYGSESMPPALLKRVHEAFPEVQLVQTYGISELGVLRSTSESSTSLWMKLGGEGIKTKVVDGMLYVRSPSAMLGSLNAPTLLSEDGWLNTQDLVEVRGDYYRIIGRASDIINVGGEKVYPLEVENVIRELDFISDAVVYGEPHPLTGNIVCAGIVLNKSLAEQDAIKQIRVHCSQVLEKFKVPVKVLVRDKISLNERLKRAG